MLFLLLLLFLSLAVAENEHIKSKVVHKAETGAEVTGRAGWGSRGALVEFTWGKEHRVESTRIKGGKGRRKRGKRLTPAGYL